MPSYVVRAVNGSIVKVTDSLDEAITTAVQFREMKLALGESEAHCNVEQKIVVYSTMNGGKPEI